MKPRESSPDTSKGLARWGWIKRYLGPAMAYIGMTSDQFDSLFLLDDQIIKTDTAGNVDGWPLSTIRLDNVDYTPTGTAPTSTADGFFYIEWSCAFNNILINDFILDPLDTQYRRDGPIVFTGGTLPYYAFYTEEPSGGTSVGISQTTQEVGPYATVRTLVAARINGVIETFGNTNDTVINVVYAGATGATFYR